jgi:hypothetical protein
LSWRYLNPEHTHDKRSKPETRLGLLRFLTASANNPFTG